MAVDLDCPAARPAQALRDELEVGHWLRLFQPGEPLPQLPPTLTPAWWQARKAWLLRLQPTGIGAQLVALEHAVSAIAWIRLDGSPARIDQDRAQALALIGSSGLQRLRGRLRVLRRLARHWQSRLQRHRTTRTSAAALAQIAQCAEQLHALLEPAAMQRALAEAQRVWASSTTVARSRELQGLMQGLVERLRTLDRDGVARLSSDIVPAYRAFAKSPDDAHRLQLARLMHHHAAALSAELERLQALCTPSAADQAAAPDPGALASLRSRLRHLAEASEATLLADLPPEQVLLQVADLAKLGRRTRRLLGMGEA